MRFLLGLALAVQSPVDRVVELITELKTKIEADGAEEQQLYDKFACWCENTTAEKAQAIDEAKARIESLTQNVEAAQGTKGTLEADIHQLNKDIAANVESRKEAEAMREKENKEYSASRAEAEQCIGALEQAVKVLEGKGERKASNLQEVETLSIVAGVKSALAKLPKRNLLSQDDLEVMEKFVQNPQHIEEDDKSFLQARQNPFGDYAPQSTKIQGILKNMYDTFVAELESSNADESQREQGFQQLMETKTNEFDTLSENLTQKKQQSGDNALQLGDDKEERGDTQQELKEDEAFFKDTKENCKQHATDWAERSRLRTEELASMKKAIEILGSDAAKGTFDSATTTFLQLGAPQHHSLRLASVASKVKMSGHFDVVINAIDKMIAMVREEDQDDIKERDRCERTQAALRGEDSDLAHDQKQQATLREHLENQIADLTRQQEEAEKNKTNTEEEFNTAKAAREAENADFKQALKDDKDAVSLLSQAMETLKAFYSNNQLSLAQVEPKPQGVGKGYGGRSSETGGIVSILGMIKGDLENEIKNSQTAEQNAQEEYEKFRSTTTKALRALKEKIANLDADIANRETQKSNSESSSGALEQDQDANATTWEAHCTGCAWVYHSKSKPEECTNITVAETSSFETRKGKRKSELDGLINAKSSLAGAAA